MIVRCLQCKQDFDIDVAPEALAAWRSGTLIQYAMPHLTPTERELLISRTCGACFDKMFPPD